MATVNLSQFNKEELANVDNFRFGIVVSEWNKDITANLLEGVLSTFIDLKIRKQNISIVKVPGSFELIYATHKLCKSNVFDAVISIGNIIRGETSHFDYICSAVAQGIKDINILTQTPAIFCVLTDENKQQSIDRSGGKYGNKGVEAAVTAIKMAQLKQEKI